MTVSAKCYYGLRAIYALARHDRTQPLSASEIAEQQDIPIKFLEAILGQLRSGRFVTSRRGAEGGYYLARDPESLTLGELIRFFDGPIAPVDCVSRSQPRACDYPGKCPFLGFWGRVRDAIAGVIDQTTFADLIRENSSDLPVYVGDWTI
jgi:Rrf2 family protein